MSGKLCFAGHFTQNLANQLKYKPIQKHHLTKNICQTSSPTQYLFPRQPRTETRKFFKKTISYERPDAVCAFAKGTNMGLEMEFDESTLSGAKDSKRDRLVSYITAFEDHDVFRKASVAYYQGESAIYQMSRSKNQMDRELLDRLARIIVERKKMKLPEK